MHKDSQASSAQSYMYLSVFALLCQYDASPESHILRERSRVLGLKSSWPTRNLSEQGSKTYTRGSRGMLARWFLLLFADGFGAYATKRALKLLGGRGSNGLRIRSPASSRSARKKKRLSSTRPTQLELALSVPLTLSAKESIQTKSAVYTNARALAVPGMSFPETSWGELYSELVSVHTSNMRPTSPLKRESRFIGNLSLVTDRD